MDTFRLFEWIMAVALAAIFAMILIAFVSLIPVPQPASFAVALIVQLAALRYGSLLAHKRLIRFEQPGDLVKFPPPPLRRWNFLAKQYGVMSVLGMYRNACLAAMVLYLIGIPYGLFMGPYAAAAIEIFLYALGFISALVLVVVVINTRRLYQVAVADYNLALRNVASPPTSKIQALRIIVQELQEKLAITTASAEGIEQSLSDLQKTTSDQEKTLRSITAAAEAIEEKAKKTDLANRMGEEILEAAVLAVDVSRRGERRHDRRIDLIKDIVLVLVGAVLGILGSLDVVKVFVTRLLT